MRWIRKYWNGQLDKVVCLEQPESGAIPATRIQAQLDKLRAAFALAEADIIHFDTHGDLEGSQVAATQALRNIPWSKHVLLLGINFNSALGSLAAAQALDRRESTVVISGGFFSTTLRLKTHPDRVRRSRGPAHPASNLYRSPFVDPRQCQASLSGRYQEQYFHLNGSRL